MILVILEIYALLKTKSSTFTDMYLTHAGPKENKRIYKTK